MARGEEGDEVADLGPLGIGEPSETRIGGGAEPESRKLVGESRWLDPPERREDLDEGDAGHVRCAEEIGWRRACPRRPGGVE